MGRHSGYRRSSARRRARRNGRNSSVSIVVSGLFLFGLLALCAAVTLPTASLLAASPSSLVASSATVDPVAASNAAGLLVLSATSIALGAVLAGVSALRPKRRVKN